MRIKKKVSVIFNILCIFLLPNYVYGGDSHCLDKSEMGLSGIMLDSKLSEIIKRLGKPNKTELVPNIYSVEGRKNGWIRYDDIDIYFHASGVQDINVKTGTYSTKSGLRLSMTYDEVSENLGFDVRKIKRLNVKEYKVLLFPVCPYKNIDVEQFLSLSFGKSERVERISIFWIMP